jgi:hypothetical protein
VNSFIIHREVEILDDRDSAIGLAQIFQPDFRHYSSSFLPVRQETHILYTKAIGNIQRTLIIVFLARLGYL